MSGTDRKPPMQIAERHHEPTEIVAVALKAYARATDDWALGLREAAALADMSESTWKRAKKPGFAGALTKDQLLRLSAVIGIYKSLELYFSEPLSKTWITRPNAGPLFGGARPVDTAIDGGLPLAAFGGKREVMEVVVDGRMAHFGTYNGNPLCMAAALAVDEVATPQALAAAEQVNDNAMEAMDTIIREYELPAHTVGFGVKGSVTWSPTPIRNYRDWKLVTDFEVAELGWLWGINRGVLTPPGMDDQWLVSLAHTDADMNKWVEAFGELAKELRA